MIMVTAPLKMTCMSSNCQMLPMAAVVNVILLARFYELLCAAIKFGPFKDFSVSCCLQKYCRYLKCYFWWDSLLIEETLLASLRTITLMMMTSHKAFLIRIYPKSLRKKNIKNINRLLADFFQEIIEICFCWPLQLITQTTFIKLKSSQQQTGVLHCFCWSLRLKQKRSIIS